MFIFAHGSQKILDIQISIDGESTFMLLYHNVVSIFLRNQ